MAGLGYVSLSPDIFDDSPIPPCLDTFDDFSMPPCPADQYPAKKYRTAATPKKYTDQMAEMETFPYQANKFMFKYEINQLVTIIINTFFAELVKSPFDAENMPLQLKGDTEESSNLDDHPFIEIVHDKGTDKLTIADKGIGLTNDDINTIIKHCDNNFMGDLANVTEVSMMGQFGFGFYTAYLVAEQVAAGPISDVKWVAGDEKKYVWESQAAGYYTVTKNISGRIKMTLFLKKYHPVAI